MATLLNQIRYRQLACRPLPSPAILRVHRPWIGHRRRRRRPTTARWTQPKKIACTWSDGGKSLRFTCRGFMAISKRSAEKRRRAGWTQGPFSLVQPREGHPAPGRVNRGMARQHGLGVRSGNRSSTKAGRNHDVVVGSDSICLTAVTSVLLRRKGSESVGHQAALHPGTVIPPWP